ncbi:MAG TPA: MBL fold metallo-hydrolase [Streptosporangiaceae bacterium]
MSGESMRITYLGHAGLRVDGEDLRLLMDPWLSERGAFQAAWFQFPANSHLSRPALLDSDYVTVSHEHLDHMDLSVLSGLGASTTVLIPRYPGSNFRNRLSAAGIRNVQEVPAWSRYPLNERGDWLAFIPEQSPMCHDAAVLVRAGAASLLHCNDARLTAGQARRAVAECGGHVDVLALQMSSATWHPICYEYPPAQIAEISAAKRAAKFKAAGRLASVVRPGLTVPFAGPMCFLDPEIRRHNRWLKAPGLFPDQKQAVDYLRPRLRGQQVALWLPGDMFDPLSGRHVADSLWRDFDFSDCDEYLDAYARARRPEIEAVRSAFPEPGADLRDAFVEHFRRLGELSPYFLERIDMTVRFEVTGAVEGRWDVDLRPEGVRVDLKGRASRPEYRFRLDSRWLAPIVFGQIGWEDLLLSMRFSAWRNPDIYNDYLVGLLKHAEPDALACVEAYERGRTADEKVVVESAGVRYQVSRYCPHAGEDLAMSSTIADGVIRCLGHNLEFDLATGSCLNARCDPLATRTLGPVPRASIDSPELEAFLCRQQMGSLARRALGRPTRARPMFRCRNRGRAWRRGSRESARALAAGAWMSWSRYCSSDCRFRSCSSSRSPQA